MADTFFVIFASTVAVTRVFMHIRPIASPTIKGFRLHHYMYGLAAVPTAIIIDSLTLYAVGLALFIDEATWLMRGGKPQIENYLHKYSVAGTIALVLVVYVFRGYVVAFWESSAAHLLG